MHARSQERGKEGKRRILWVRRGIHSKEGKKKKKKRGEDRTSDWGNEALMQGEHDFLDEVGKIFIVRSSDVHCPSVPKTESTKG